MVHPAFFAVLPVRLSLWVWRRASARRLLLAGLAASMAILSFLGRPAQAAYSVQVVPSSPALGDTIAVIVQGSGQPPTVSARGQDYPAYDLEENRFRALIPTSPLDQPGRIDIRVNGDRGTNNIAVGLRNRSFPTQSITLSPGRAGLEGTDYEFDRMDALKALTTPEKYWDGPMERPSRGAVSSLYGLRRYYNGVFAEDYYHRGVDYAEGNGAPIYAPAAGRIALVGRVADGFQLNGNTIGIDHGQGVTSVMIHLSGFEVNEGDFVEAGQLIGRMGATGFATGPNLHWGLYVNGVAVDPVPWRYDGVE
ncbi:M23 family metallopeptidase [Romeria aff. gracilis LEGE 07310]|uniref:M23 family metallopeptidase n=1 Tax=Vasconcelosia minhoensis LEGE 07310 TaxID=915328 RepID=A0A8J7DQW4_9CYAN|nr:M23 family metallopeptidase [Romeria gracilis]MBE9077254.1 M23 family metallopeptidase [Romeria aff. gracilis LEGE 07310]